jgi:hypothetical protein
MNGPSPGDYLSIYLRIAANNAAFLLFIVMSQSDHLVRLLNYN